MSVIKSRSFESTLNSDEKNDVLYLGDRAEPGIISGGSGTSLNNNRSSSKLSIRRRRKNQNRSSSTVE